MQWYSKKQKYLSWGYHFRKNKRVEMGIVIENLNKRIRKIMCRFSVSWKRYRRAGYCSFHTFIWEGSCDPHELSCVNAEIKL